jgi:hypothetical protein
MLSRRPGRLGRRFFSENLVEFTQRIQAALLFRMKACTLTRRYKEQFPLDDLCAAGRIALNAEWPST